MNNGLEGLANARSEYLWLAAELIAERIFSAILARSMAHGPETGGAGAKDFLESLRNDRERRWHFVEDDLYLLTGATEAEIDLIVDDYIPVFLEGQIEFLETVLDSPQRTSDEIPVESIPKRRRRGERWTRKEHLAVLFFEVTLRDELTSPQNHPLTEKLATALRRTIASIAMRIGNYRSLDPEYPGVGLDGGGELVAKIWREYEANPDRVLAEARRAYQEFVPDEEA